MTDDEIMKIVRYSTVDSAAIDSTEWCAFARALLSASKAAAVDGEVARDDLDDEEIASTPESDRAARNATTRFMLIRAVQLWRTKQEMKEHMMWVLNWLREQGVSDKALGGGTVKLFADASSVEQDERGAYDEYMEAWQRQNHNGENYPTTREAFENGWSMACATSTSANVAQGAVAAEAADIQQYVLSVLPGVYYMDPPDGGSVSVLEQLRRMADDAARYRAIAAPPAQTAQSGESEQMKRRRIYTCYDRNGEFRVFNSEANAVRANCAGTVVAWERAE